MALGQALPIAQAHGAVARLIPITDVNIGMEQTARPSLVDLRRGDCPWPNPVLLISNIPWD